MVKQTAWTDQMSQIARLLVARMKLPVTQIVVFRSNGGVMEERNVLMGMMKVTVEVNKIAMMLMFFQIFPLIQSGSLMQDLNLFHLIYEILMVYFSTEPYF